MKRNDEIPSLRNIVLFIVLWTAILCGIYCYVKPDRTAESELSKAQLRNKELEQRVAYLQDRLRETERRIASSSERIVGSEKRIGNVSDGLRGISNGIGESIDSLERAGSIVEDCEIIVKEIEKAIRHEQTN